MTKKVAKSRSLVKLDDKIIEIVKNEKGLKARELTADEVFEISVLDTPVENLIKNDLNTLANEAYDELQNTFKHDLKKNVLKIVGFNNSWDKWEVDHCNGRSSVLTEYMSVKVQQMFRAEFEKMLQPEIEDILKPVKKAFLDEFKNAFKREAQGLIYSETREQAKKFISELAAKQIQKYQKEITKGVELSFLGRTAKPENGDED